MSYVAGITPSRRALLASSLGQTFFICAGLAILTLLAGAISPDNSLAWLSAGSTIFACALILRQEMAIAPSLFILIAMFWLVVVADILGADLQGVALDGPEFGGYRITAIELSLVSLVIIAIGVRVGFDVRRVRATQVGNKRRNLQPSLRAAFRFYVLTVLATLPLSLLASAAPSLAQPITAFSAIHLVALFIFTLRLKTEPMGTLMIGGVMLAEGVVGATSYIASFQPAFLTAVAAALTGTYASRRAMRLKSHELATLIVSAGMVLFFSVVWTAIKPQFRALIATNDLSFIERANFVSNQILDGRVDYADAAVRLVDRLGYTRYYALVLDRQAAGILPPTSLWVDAIRNVIMPRVLFPDKAALNDTAITTMLTGVQFDAATSVSVGYVAEAQIDFGFPLMLLPLGLLGAAIGRTMRFFFLSDVPFMFSSAFVTASLTAVYKYEADFSKLFGGFVLLIIALRVIFKWRLVIISYLTADKLPRRRA